MAGSAEFVQLDELNSGVVADFVPLLSQLSSGFAKKSPEEKEDAIQRNLTAALNNPDAFVLVNRDDDGRIVATATGGIVLESEGWVDDVVTLADQRGRGLGRRSMEALHDRFAAAAISVVRLTSKLDRDVAGNLYAKMGYEEGGTVWRDADFHANGFGGFNPTNPSFEAVNCTIPTGNKAWIYGPNRWQDRSLPFHITAAEEVLASNGITSINYFNTAGAENISPELRDALADTDFEERSTRLYTLDLNQQPQEA